MATSPDIPVIPLEEMQRLWIDNHIAEKLASGLLVKRVAEERPVGDPLLSGFTYKIIKIVTRDGDQHIGTISETADSSGTIRQSKPKDYTFRDCSRVRILNQQELGGKKWRPRNMKIRRSHFTA